MNAQPSRMLACLLGLALCWCLVASANATVINGVYGANIEYVSGGAVISDGSGVTFQGRTWDVPSSRTVRATDTAAPLRLGGKDIHIDAARTMTPIAIGRASALALKALPVIGTGIAIWDIWDAVRVTPDGAGGIVWDAGANTQTVSQYSTSFAAFGACSAKTATGPTAEAAVQQIIDHWNACGYQDTPGNCASGSASRTDRAFSNVSCTGAGETKSCTYSRQYTSYAPWSCAPTTGNEPGQSYGNVSPTNTQSCPESIDASNPAYNIPAGLPVGPDGKCRTARYNHQPITPTQAADKLETQAPPTGEQLKEMAKDAVARGEAIEASERQLSGPASAPGTPTVTTAPNPGGGTTTTTKTPTTHYTYNNNTVNYTVVTVTTVNDGTTTTTTTEGSVPQESDQCKTAPDSLGCSKMGTPGSEAPTWQTRDVVFAPEDLGFSGSCPAPESWEVFGITLTWGYEPICEVAPFIRFALLAFAGIGAISIVIRETQS